MEDLSMDRVYDYMYHLIMEYSKLQDFKPIPSSSAREVCLESLLCFADTKQRQFLERSTAFASEGAPCSFEAARGITVTNWIKQKEKAIQDVRKKEMSSAETQSD